MALGVCVDTTASVGTKLYIGAALPATYDTAGYDAVSWEEIGLVESISEFGPETEVNTFTPLGTGVDCTAVGKTNNGTIDFVVALTETDAGITDVEAHFAAQSNLPYKVETTITGVVSPHRFFVSGICTRNRYIPGGPGDVAKKSFQVAINSDVVEADHADA